MNGFKLIARPDKSLYRSGDIMTITATLYYDKPPISGYFIIKDSRMSWRTLPVKDLQVPMVRTIPVQIPYCTVVQGYTVTGYKVPCPTNSVPINGPVKFTVEFHDMKGRLLASDSFTVTIKGTAPIIKTAPQPEKKGIPWWLIAGGAILLFGGS